MAKEKGKREALREELESAEVESRYVSAEKRRIIADLAREGLSNSEIALIADVTESTAKKWAMRAREANESAKASVIVQRTQNTNTLTQRLAVHAEDTSVRILKRINDLIPTTDDISKLATALRVLTQIAESNKITTTMTATVSRLRDKTG